MSMSSVISLIPVVEIIMSCAKCIVNSFNCHTFKLFPHSFIRLAYWGMLALCYPIWCSRMRSRTCCSVVVTCLGTPAAGHPLSCVLVG